MPDAVQLSPEERLAVLYDSDNPDGPDHDYFRRLAAEAGAARITDLCCGTGILTVTLARPEKSVVGIDPDPSMLSQARQRQGGNQVEWRLGTSELIAPQPADLVIMSGNVAMHILKEDWHRTLRDISAGLVTGGVLAFETRNPKAEAWRDWNDPLADRETLVGRLRESTTTSAPDPYGIVTMLCHNEFDDGSVLDVEQKLQFRSFATVTEDLTRAGLEVVRVSRNWREDAFTDTAAEPLMIFEAERPVTR